MKTNNLHKRNIQRLCALALALSTFQINSSGSPGVTDTAVNPANGHTYHLLENANWPDSEAVALTLGGHLATVNNQAENNWLWSQWGTGRSLWIGFNDVATEGTFVWASGEPVTYTNWYPGEPNDANDGEDFAYIIAFNFNPTGQWNDYDFRTTTPPQPALYGVVEVVPEPAPVLLFGAGFLVWLVGLSIRRKRLSQ